MKENEKGSTEFVRVVVGNVNNGKKRRLRVVLFWSFFFPPQCLDGEFFFSENKN
jgi:hypothetical protein